jgi:hypothetical protein
MIGILLLIPFLLWGTFRTVKCVQFNFDCQQHLKRAADANTIDLAAKELITVIAYCDKHELKSGTVSVFFHQPKNDVGFWYTNITESLKELLKVNDKTSQLERSNILIKLRETLTDQGESLHITCPEGITIYPHNVLYALWGFFGLVIGCIGGYLIISAINEY